MQLPFPDASFDVVFCRYLLLHMADPVRVVREMLRVARPGGFVVAFEGDFTIASKSHPPCAALATIHHVWQALFQNPPAGATLVHTFRQAGATALEAGAWTMLEHDATRLRRIYRLSAEATGPLAASRGILTATEVDEMIHRTDPPRGGPGQRRRDVPRHLGDRHALARPAGPRGTVQQLAGFVDCRQNVAGRPLNTELAPRAGFGNRARERAA
jgi:SAM-dependent methyltransferase